MVTVFLSHSSKDIPLARRIALDLREAGVAVWLDEWEILVGDSISQRIQRGLDQSDFVALLLTQASVDSGWVAKEWQSQIGKEADTKDVVVLPLYADNCRMPTLLADKKCADFVGDYATGLAELIVAIKGHASRASQDTSSTKLHVPAASTHDAADSKLDKTNDLRISPSSLSHDSFLAIMQGFSTDSQKLGFLTSNHERIGGVFSFSDFNKMLGLFRVDSSKLSAIELMRKHVASLSNENVNEFIANFELGTSQQSALERLR